MDAASYGSRATDGNVVREGLFAGRCLGTSGAAKARAGERDARHEGISAAPRSRSRGRGGATAGGIRARYAAALSAGPAPSNRDRLRYVEGETSWWRRKAFANWAGWR
jgi:hypothetical protein